MGIIGHVLLALFAAVHAEEGELKKELSYDDPVTDWFPELHLNVEEKKFEENWQNDPDTANK